MSDSLGDTPWYLRMLRDSSDAARRLTRVLASSRYVSDLFRGTPTSVAWLEQDAELQPRALEPLQEEALAVLDRHDTEGAAHVLRGIRRRELLRLAVAAILNLTPMPTIAAALSSLAQSHLQALLAAIRGPEPDGIEFAIIGMGRFGGGELGFGSDVDILYVYRPTTAEPDAAHSRAQWIVSELVRLSEDPRLPFVLDADLRPEGRNGVVVRSVEAYRAYYERWSLTWEAQALLRARPVAGDAALQAAFLAVVDPVRYPSRFGEAERREVRRIKARMEKERLPKGADPKRHLKLGRGSLSDVEWFVQLIQLQHAAAVPTLRTCSTLAALDGAVAAGFVSASDATILTDAWQVASRARSALTLWLAKTTDVLPADRMQLEGVARLMGYPIGSASHLEEEYLLRTRQARAVFERGFYGA